MLYTIRVIQERNQILRIEEQEEDFEEQDVYEPTEEELEESARQKAERYWRRNQNG